MEVAGEFEMYAQTMREFDIRVGAIHTTHIQTLIVNNTHDICCANKWKWWVCLVSLLQTIREFDIYVGATPTMFTTYLYLMHTIHNSYELCASNMFI